jgi:hypothetical protein
MVDTFNFDMASVGNQIIAIGALGTASFGLADASKVFWGGPSRAGFGYIVKALRPFAPALRNAVGKCDGDHGWKVILRSHWINGRDANDQKAIATSMIQLGLTPESAEKIAPLVHLESAAFAAMIEGLTKGAEMTPEQVNMLGRFKASIEAVIDAAYERADQAYRNTMRMVSGAVSVALALAANDLAPTPAGSWKVALLVGLIAVPLAPIAKDIASALQAAGSAIGSLGSKK